MATHDLDMGIPQEFGTEVDPQVLDSLQTRDSEYAMDHIVDPQVGEWSTKGRREAARSSKGDEFQLI